MLETKAEAHFTKRYSEHWRNVAQAKAQAFGQRSWTLHCHHSGPSQCLYNRLCCSWTHLKRHTGRICHRYGYLTEGNTCSLSRSSNAERILVMTLLADWRKKELLKWPQRMAITIGVARGVQFLHTGVAPGIFGNNMKINNILLDDSLSTKISNYNIPLPSKVSNDMKCIRKILKFYILLY